MRHGSFNEGPFCNTTALSNPGAGGTFRGDESDSSTQLVSRWSLTPLLVRPSGNGHRLIARLTERQIEILEIPPRVGVVDPVALREKANQVEVVRVGLDRRRIENRFAADVRHDRPCRVGVCPRGRGDRLQDSWRENEEVRRVQREKVRATALANGLETGEPRQVACLQVAHVRFVSSAPQHHISATGLPRGQPHGVPLDSLDLAAVARNVLQVLDHGPTTRDEHLVPEVDRFVGCQLVETRLFVAGAQI